MARLRERAPPSQLLEHAPQVAHEPTTQSLKTTVGVGVGVPVGSRGTGVGAGVAMQETVPESVPVAHEYEPETA
jgi:hypothetical protein